MIPGLPPELGAAVLCLSAAAGLSGALLVGPGFARVLGPEGPSGGRLPAFLRTRPRLFSLGAVSLALPFLVARAPFLILGGALCVALVLAVTRRSPVWLAAWRQRDRRRRCAEAVPQALEMATQALRSGQTVPQALAYLAQELPPPLRDEFASLVAELGLGATPEESLQHLAGRLEDPDLARFLESYRLSRRTGVDLSRLLQVQSEGIEERHRILRRLDSMTAQARLSGLLMGSLPVFLMGALYLLDAEMLLPLFERPEGWGVLALAALLEVLGFTWIRSLMRLEL